MSKQVNTFDVYGLWRVSTEGDCEVRSIHNLGIWEGFIDDIALHLADKVMYNLWFEPVDIKKVTEAPMARQVAVTIRSVGLPLVDKDKVLEMAKASFAHRNVRIGNCSNFGAFTIYNNRSEEEILRSSALSKLTAAERKVLGL